MSDFLEQRMSASSRAHERESAAAADLTAVTAAVIGGAKRRRRVRAMGASGALAGVLLVAAAGAAAALGTFDDDPATPVTYVTESPSPSATPSATPSASPSPTATAPELPPAAQPRGTGYPAAYEMRDWVWDEVAEGWAIESYSLLEDVFAEQPQALPLAALYLVDPAGTRYELQVLDAAHSGGLRVISWQPEAKTVHIMWYGDGNGTAEDHAPGAAILDLTTGALDPIVFTTPWGESEHVAPAAVSAAGNELWVATIDDKTRYYRISAQNDWTVASVHDLPGLGQAAGGSGWYGPTLSGWEALATRSDGAAAVFESQVWSVENASFLPPDAIAVYDVDSDTYTVSPQQLNPSGSAAPWCHLMSWTGAADLAYECWGEGIETHTVHVEAVGAPPWTPVPTSRRPTIGFGESFSAQVRYGESTQLDYLYYVCGC